MRRTIALLALSAFLGASLLLPTSSGGAPLAQATAGGALQGAILAGPLFPQTGFRLGTAPGDALGEYFVARGGVSTFGYPVSRPLLLQGVNVQFFQRYVLQQLPTGIGLLNILDEEYMPYTDFGTAVVPPFDPQVAAGAPGPGTPGYGQAVTEFVARTAPNTWEGQPVGFFDAWLATGAAGGATDPTLQALIAVETLGFPTSAPAADPRDPNFVYQRFQRSVLQHNAATRQTQPLLVADFFKSIITGRDLTPALAAQAQGSRFLQQYRPDRLGWVARPAELADTDFTLAFEPEVPVPGANGGPNVGANGGSSAVPTPPQAPPTAFPLAPLPAPTSVSFQPTPGFILPVPTFGSPPPPPEGSTTTPTRNPDLPVLQNAEPGGAAVGQDVILRGRHFGDQAGQVLFTGKLATAQLWSNELIVVTVPQGATDGTIRIRRADTVLSNAIGFAPATTPTPSPTNTTPSPTLSPTITPTPTPGAAFIASLSLQLGFSGQSVVITGTHFGRDTGQVLFGGYEAPVSQVGGWSDTSIIARVPFELGGGRAVQVFVRRPDGVVSNFRCFQVLSPTHTPTPISGSGPIVPTPDITATPLPTPATSC